jgi:ketosteroid isomerase-like protein
MRRRAMLILAIVAFVLVPCSRAQSAAELERLRELAREREAKGEELVNLEKETARALQWNNGALFRRVYGEDFVGILPSGQIMNKAGWIASIENSGAKYSSFVATDIRVRMFEETAVVTCLWSSRGTRDGHPFSRQSRVTHVYIYGQRGWQAVASQETLLPG